MSTILEYQKQIEERRIIKVETKTTKIISAALISSAIISGLIAYFLHFRQVFPTPIQDQIRGITSIGIVMVMVVIFYLRRTLYYSPKIIKEDFTLSQVLQQWRKIDIALLLIAESLPICGLVLAFLGLQFDRIFHFFLGGVLMMIILTPMGIKVRSRLSILREFFPEI